MSSKYLKEKRGVCAIKSASSILASSNRLRDPLMLENQNLHLRLAISFNCVTLVLLKCCHCACVTGSGSPQTRNILNHEHPSGNTINTSCNLLTKTDDNNNNINQYYLGDKVTINYVMDKDAITLGVSLNS